VVGPMKMRALFLPFPRPSTSFLDPFPLFMSFIAVLFFVCLSELHCDMGSQEERGWSSADHY